MVKNTGEDVADEQSVYNDRPPDTQEVKRAAIVLTRKLVIEVHKCFSPTCLKVGLSRFNAEREGTSLAICHEHWLQEAIMF